MEMDAAVQPRHSDRMEQISAVRFNAIAGYARAPHAAWLCEELAYFERDGGRIVGMMVRDRADGDFSGMVFAPDKKLRFRNVMVAGFSDDQQEAFALFSAAMKDAADAPPEAHYQEDEKGEPVDFFTPVHPPEKLNPDFVSLISNEANSPARGIIEKMMRWYDDVDGNFIEQFQTTGFDQRIWELYLFATLVELGYVFDRSQPMPDYVCSGLAGRFSLEAVTVGPTRQGSVIVPPPPRDTLDEQLAYIQQYMPIKFGSALYAKLGKRYWEKPHVAQHPFILAVADFSSPGSMMASSSGLERYLFGYEHDGELDADGRLAILPRRIEQHSFGEKVIPSGFFRLPDAANISAVVSTSAGTISKFNRMGVLAGFGTGRVLLIRDGNMPDPDPNATEPLRFRALVNAPDYDESWVEGLNVYHNPTAKDPLDRLLFPGAAHHDCADDGQVSSTLPAFHPFASTTIHRAPVDVAAIVREAGKNTHMIRSGGGWTNAAQFWQSR